MVDKERDCVRRVQAAREEEFEKFARVENEKYVFSLTDWVITLWILMYFLVPQNHHMQGNHSKILVFPNIRWGESISIFVYVTK